jgi:acyl-coenzyme A synthetase/AMP-(fatty) acid ligase
MGEALRRHLAPNFDATLLPKRFRFVKELPISERGKVISQELVQLFA